MNAWQLKWYHDTATLQNDITYMMNSGYFPMGISYTGDVFFVIYIQPRTGSATAWQLVPASATMASVKAAITPYTSQFYLPCGITRYGSQFWTLLVQIPDTTAKLWEIEQYVADNNIIQSSIDNALARGRVPWGFTYSGNTVTVLYTGF